MKLQYLDMKGHIQAVVQCIEKGRQEMNHPGPVKLTDPHHEMRPPHREVQVQPCQPEPSPARPCPPIGKKGNVPAQFQDLSGSRISAETQFA